MNQYSKICVEFWSDRAQSHFITKYSPDSQFHFECFIRDFRRLRVDVKVKTCLPNSTKCFVPLYIVIYIQIHCSPAELYFILYTLYWIGLDCGGRLWMFGLIEYKSIKIFFLLFPKPLHCVQHTSSFPNFSNEFQFYECMHLLQCHESRV